MYRTLRSPLSTEKERAINQEDVQSLPGMKVQSAERSRGPVKAAPLRYSLSLCKTDNIFGLHNINYNSTWRANFCRDRTRQIVQGEVSCFEIWIFPPKHRAQYFVFFSVKQSVWAGVIDDSVFGKKIIFPNGWGEKARDRGCCQQMLSLRALLVISFSPTQAWS